MYAYMYIHSQWPSIHQLTISELLNHDMEETPHLMETTHNYYRYAGWQDVTARQEIWPSLNVYVNLIYGILHRVRKGQYASLRCITHDDSVIFNGGIDSGIYIQGINIFDPIYFL